MSDVTQWMVDQLVKPEVQAEIIEYYEGVSMDAVRLAWPFKTEAEREVIQKFLKKKVRQEKKYQLSKLDKAPF
jgi:hypothetical protein